LLVAGVAHAQEEGSAGDVSRAGGGGVAWRSDDGRFGLRFGLRGQVRAQVVAPSGGDAVFDLIIPRARVLLSGHLFGEHNRFDLQLAFSPDDLGWVEGEGPTFTPLLDYALIFDYLRDLTVVVGQRKIPFARERLTSSGDLAMVDRSVVDDALSLDRDLGAWLRSDDLFGAGFFRYWLGVSAAEGRDGLVGDDFHLAWEVRLELLPLGLFDSDTQGDPRRNETPRLAIGAAYVFIDHSPWVDGLDGRLPADGGTTDIHAGALDALFLFGGFTAEVDVLLRYGTRNPGTEGPVTPPSNGAGGFAQVSYLLPDTFVELTARYGMVRAIGDPTSFEDQGELGGAVSLYFEGHELKLQLDYFHLWGAPEDFGRGEERVRLQLQATL
jgi:hypothetical protein